ncbi:MAG: hypothetical protein VYA08_12395 [Pseudomonadota bacterium]|nr:hypothetical protein [Pseudomonadota bacterium]
MSIGRGYLAFDQSIRQIGSIVKFAFASAAAFAINAGQMIIGPACFIGSFSNGLF